MTKTNTTTSNVRVTAEAMAKTLTMPTTVTYYILEVHQHELDQLPENSYKILKAWHEDNQGNYLNNISEFPHPYAWYLIRVGADQLDEVPISSRVIDTITSVLN